MGSGEMGTPTKTTKTSTPQEQPPATTSPIPYQEWAAAFQAYYGTGMSHLPPPGYFPPATGTGAQPHPYMWGGQPLMPPYGTPPPYAAMYPHGGIYGHPPMTQVVGSIGTDAEGKSNVGKSSKKSGKKAKGNLGSLGMITGKVNEPGKANISPVNGGVISQSADSGSEGSTDASEENSPNASQDNRQNGFAQGTSEAANPNVVNATPHGNTEDVNHLTGSQSVSAIPTSMGEKQVMGAGPLTNLNIGMDYWNGGSPAVLGANRGKRGSVANTSTLIPSQNTVSGEMWIQDEREMKRQRRKQSNRESARRSRLRKQAECEELAAKVQSLTSENATLREELNRMTEECKKLSAENSSLVDQLQLQRTEALNGDLDKVNSSVSKTDVLGDGLHDPLLGDTHRS